MWPGRAGIRILESGMAARTFRSEWASELASSGAMDGAGIIGDLIGTTAPWFTTTTGTTRKAGPSITGMSITVEGPADLVHPAEQQGTGPRRGTSRNAAMSTTTQGQRPSLSREIHTRHAGTLSLTDRATSSLGPSAAMTTGVSRGATRPEAAPAWEEEALMAAGDRTEAVAHHTTSLRFALFLRDRKT